MTRVTCNISVSVDGYVAGPRQSLANPIGVGGMLLHNWHFNPQGEDQLVGPQHATPLASATRIVGLNPVLHGETLTVRSRRGS